MKLSYSFKLTVYLYLIGFLLTLILFPFPKNNSEVKPEVLGRSYPLSLPDIPSGDGETLNLEGVSAIVPSGTFTVPVYLKVDKIARTTPKSASGLWQVSDLYSVRFRDHRNDNEMRESDAGHDFTISIPYTTDYLLTEQGVWLDEISLKLAWSESENGIYELLSGSVLDLAADKVSVLTKNGGYFMVVGGFDDNENIKIKNEKIEQNEKNPIKSDSEESEKTDVSESAEELTEIEVPTAQVYKETVENITFVQSLQNLLQAFIEVPKALWRSL